MNKDLEKGYSDTGYIPEEGDNLGRLEEMAKEEAKCERMEKEMAKKNGYQVEEEVGGFLERRNRDDRM
jgi:hypothetical protein